MFKGIATEIWFFKGKDSAFTISIMPLMMPMKLNDSEELYLEGSYPDEMYLISRGRVNLVISNEICFKSFLKGTHIGEIELLLDL